MQPKNWSVLGPAGDGEMDSDDPGPGLATHSSTNLVGGTLSSSELDSLGLHLEESELLGNYYEEDIVEEELEVRSPSPPIHSKNDSDQKKNQTIHFYFANKVPPMTKDHQDLDKGVEKGLDSLELLSHQQGQRLGNKSVVKMVVGKQILGVCT